jgi:hypothetical protein
MPLWNTPFSMDVSFASDGNAFIYDTHLAPTWKRHASLPNPDPNPNPNPKPEPEPEPRTLNPNPNPEPEP